MKRKYFKTITAICLSLFITLFFACDTVPDRYEINFGCGGGFTGMHHSYTVTQDGTVYYSVLLPDESALNREGMIIGDISRTDVIGFYSRLVNISFNTIEYVKPDNMSCSLGLTVAETTHSVTWPMGFNDTSPPDVMKPVVEIFKDIDKMVSPMRPK